MNREKLEKIIEKNRGFVTSKELKVNSIPSIELTRLVKKNIIVKIDSGFYARKDWVVDKYLVFQYCCSRYIYSFYSAIALLGLGDINPSYLEVTGPKNYRPMGKREDNVVTHTDINNERYNLGIEEVITPLGNKVLSYNAEKTVCDLIRNKEKIELEVFIKAIRAYSRRKDKNINRLMEYARVMKIENKVSNIMEIVLNED